MSSPAQRECAICPKLTSKMCPCKTVAFCCTEHQRLIWHSHKLICGKNPETFELPLITKEEHRAFVEACQHPPVKQKGVIISEEISKFDSYPAAFPDRDPFEVAWEFANKNQEDSPRQLREKYIRRVRQILLAVSHPVLRTLPRGVLPFYWVGLVHSCLPEGFPSEYPVPCQFPEWATNDFNRQALIYFTLAEIAELPTDERPQAFEDDMLQIATKRGMEPILGKVSASMMARGHDPREEGPSSSLMRSWSLVFGGVVGPGKKPPPVHGSRLHTMSRSDRRLEQS